MQQELLEVLFKKKKTTAQCEPSEKTDKSKQALCVSPDTAYNQGNIKTAVINTSTGYTEST